MSLFRLHCNLYAQKSGICLANIAAQKKYIINRLKSPSDYSGDKRGGGPSGRPPSGIQLNCSRIIWQTPVTSPWGAVNEQVSPLLLLSHASKTSGGGPRRLPACSPWADAVESAAITEVVNKARPKQAAVTKDFKGNEGLVTFICKSCPLVYVKIKF